MSNCIEIGTDCNAKDFICVDQTSFLVCIDDGNGSTLSVDNEVHLCSQGNICDNDQQTECSTTEDQTSTHSTSNSNEATTEDQSQVTNSEENTTEKSIEVEMTTEAVIQPKPIPPPFECVASGKFPDANDCELYHVCIWTPFGTFTIDRSCNGLTYDPILRKCSEDASTCNAETFKCTETGRFEDPANAQQYILCVKSLLGDQFAQYILRCPFLTIFDKVQQKCTYEFFPGDISTMEDNNSNEQKHLEPENTNQGDQGDNNQDGNKSGESDEKVKVKFICPAVGTFSDPNNSEKYFVCTLKKKDKLKKKSMKCAKGQFFDEATLVCMDPSTLDSNIPHQDGTKNEEIDEQDD